jgi:hypothetical protein
MKQVKGKTHYGKTGYILSNVNSLLRQEFPASPTTGQVFTDWYTARMLLLQNVDDMYKSKTGTHWEGIEKETNQHLLDTAYRLCGRNAF